ncbi:hydroxymethylbilane synthase [Nocardioides albertanoniae]|uniref:Porphobilinogen deaminase n=1 Tax=Nocardioides albertanoniae TaxID=1175486 RepID=A0A543ADK6_9ACTN|nr:hydroxymethylbilane synthase [Nocardioides albertanoniae]TQL70661.1 hydroxymethylbilane synthase [Nocardioides albertanoniae]
MRTLRLGTRRSRLAVTQSTLVADMLRARGYIVELVEIVSDGDRTQATNTPLTSSSSTGVFVSALRDALHAKEIDLAVHSLKDLPTYPEEGIDLAAVLPREDPRDVVVARDGLTLGELPPGSRVGTGSPRRVAQIKALGLGLELGGIRGNIDTRIGKVRSGEFDAIVIARAGLARIDRLDEATEILDPIQVLPAPGQGALAVECRDGDADADVRKILTSLDDSSTRAIVEAERAVLATLEGGCAAPIGTLADLVEGEEGPELWVRAVALSLDGSLSVRLSASGPVDDAAGVGRRLGEEMLAEGAADLTDEPTDNAEAQPEATSSGQAVMDTGGSPQTAPEQDKVHNS